MILRDFDVVALGKFAFVLVKEYIKSFEQKMARLLATSTKLSQEDVSQNLPSTIRMIKGNGRCEDSYIGLVDFFFGKSL